MKEPYIKTKFTLIMIGILIDIYGIGILTLSMAMYQGWEIPTGLIMLLLCYVYLANELADLVKPLWKGEATSIQHK